MTSSHSRQTAIVLVVCALALTAFALNARAQSAEPAGTAVEGHVRDSSGNPVANATVSLASATDTTTTATSAQSTRTNAEGAFRFAAIREGAYTLRAEMIGYSAVTLGPVDTAVQKTKQIDLVLIPNNETKSQASSTAKTQPGNSTAHPPDFFDEPQFTVAGVTQATNSGGHGSDTVGRTTEALAKATVSLGKESSYSTNLPASSSVSEDSIRKALARNPNDAALHRRLGDIEEKENHPLEAVREYQRAAELDPSEPNLFAWGTELLVHRTLEPAAEVFTNGHRLFPKSVRMLVTLGVTAYARGSYDQATNYLVSASDLDPDNPTPYLFLGRMQSVEQIPSPRSVETLARFAKLQPENALANYYYAVALWKESAGSEDAERSARVEALLLKAISLDPKLGAADLQLGILYSQRQDFSRAISAYQKAIDVSSESDETLAQAHFRLAQVYVHSGDKDKAKVELELHRQLMSKIKDDADHERRGIQEFVVSLRDQTSASPEQR